MFSAISRCFASSLPATRLVKPKMHANMFVRNWQKADRGLITSRCRSVVRVQDAEQKIQPSDSKPREMLVKTNSNFCRLCGAPMALVVPAGDGEERHVCSSCGYIDYFNPKMVVGCIVEHEGKILLCRRGIEPRIGAWTLPAGFMELNESSEEGAVRETREEANAHVQVTAPYAHWDIPVIGQAYIIFRAKLVEPYTFSPGVETLETALFDPSDIPYEELAFSSVSITLQYYVQDLRSGTFRVHHGVIDKRPGSAPNDKSSFEVKNHMAFSIVR